MFSRYFFVQMTRVFYFRIAVIFIISIRIQQFNFNMIELFMLLLLLLLVTRPLPRDGGMAEDHGAPEAGQLPRVWTKGCTETESRQRVSGAKSP